MCMLVHELSSPLFMTFQRKELFSIDLTFTHTASCVEGTIIYFAIKQSCNDYTLAKLFIGPHDPRFVCVSTRNKKKTSIRYFADFIKQ